MIIPFIMEWLFRIIIDLLFQWLWWVIFEKNWVRLKLKMSSGRESGSPSRRRNQKRNVLRLIILLILLIKDWILPYGNNLEGASISDDISGLILFPFCPPFCILPFLILSAPLFSFFPLLKYCNCSGILDSYL